MSPSEWRRLLTLQEYDPNKTDQERLASALAWGRWIINESGGWRERPEFRSTAGGALNIGYVSSDLCQHTVGLLVKDVLTNHDRKKFRIFTYVGNVTTDWVTDEIAKYTNLRNIAHLSDHEASELIKFDQVDILIDLSGHTANSRLAIFALRPAPVMLSWVGYFASTGLPYIDGVLVDKFHVADETTKCFTETLYELNSRFFYKPVPWCPRETVPPPVLTTGQITFGSFNNIWKLNRPVISLWSAILKAVPNSRLVLKWDTLDEQTNQDIIKEMFSLEGIEKWRIHLGGRTSHDTLLREYNEIDVALDPFPFSGGYTSLEALWMGLPVVTKPETRLASRQTYSILKTTGCLEGLCFSENEYFQTAVTLSCMPDKLLSIRANNRRRMRKSKLMNIDAFMEDFEATLTSIYVKVKKLS